MATARSPVRRPRITLDGQLVGYWEREAARLDLLAAKAQFGWIARRYARKAEKARAKAAFSRAREEARGAPPADPPAAPSPSPSPEGDPV